MNRLEEVLERSEPTMAVSITKPIGKSALRSISAIADVAEFRADLFPSTDVSYLQDQIQSLEIMPTLLTIRYENEGGQWSGSEDERLTALQRLMPHVDGVDIELAADIMPEVVEAATDNQKVTVVSSHDFHGTPSTEDLWRFQEEAGSVGDYIKLAAMANTVEDYQRLADFTLNTTTSKLIVVAMGRFGPLSRIAFPGLGSHLTYAFAGDKAVAPGQLDYIETHELLKKMYPDYLELFAA